MGKELDLHKFMPLTETSFYILISLLEPLHGYAIMQKVERLSKGRIVFGPGTLYGALNNLQSLGLITPYGETSGSVKRKTYVITTIGRQLVDQEINRLQEMLDNAKMLISVL
jgi:DNA-binding PadR family transcriptional regulator